MGWGRGASDYLYFLSQSAAFLTPDKYDQSWNNNNQKQAKPRLLEPAAHSTDLCWGSGCVRPWSKTCCLKLSYAIETGLHPSWALTIVYDLQAQYHKSINAQRSSVYSCTSRLDLDRGNNGAEVANVLAVPFLIGGFREAEGAQYLEGSPSLLLVGWPLSYMDAHRESQERDVADCQL